MLGRAVTAAWLARPSVKHRFQSATIYRAAVYGTEDASLLNLIWSPPRAL
jgi:hypothetical protein